MSDTWTISVAGQAYGPYAITQMQSFVGEGRLAPHSLVARYGETQFTPAGDDPILSSFFRPATPAATPAPQPVKPTPFFTAEGSEEPAKFGRQEEPDTTGERTHYIVVADMKSRSISGVEEEIFNLGPAVPIMPQAWLLSSDMPINQIRQTLVQKLGKMDMLFIADATNAKAAWFNFGPEADARIRRIWQKTPDASRRAG